MYPNQDPAKHFYTFDAFRGIASIIVVLYHWQLFYYANDVFVLGQYDKTALPFYHYLAVFYNDGMVAVDIFFLLSGFIFFWLYSERVASGKMKFRQFFTYRLSRLYPIHFVTLLIVTMLQWMMVKNVGHTFIIQYNDAYHFILNVFLMQNWGLEKGASFNGPSWSISVEVFLYFLFFIICYLKLQRKKWLLFLMIPAGVFLQSFTLLIGKGMYSFFLGALVYYLYVWMTKENRIRKYLPALTTITILLWAMILAEYHFSYIQGLWTQIVHQWLPGKNEEFITVTFGQIRNFFFRSTVSPCTILSLALWETKRDLISKKWALLGNCSYAIYLIHFPLQIIFVLTVDTFHISRYVLRSPYTMMLFFALLLPLSLLTYYYFELPAQEKIRDWFYKRYKRRTSIATVNVTT
ncbi:acyltransferase family protein [Chitinophaga arvensicola]|uniref:Peptidoglycan/LPS O-acetylase OafA/YrhL, contains acyltransferase and SGNH-hydrolase domains n=1 Tax=Chitinophaga arvensicola TaxID=29529 RepID=A0A1I0S4R7_9BACT|nr:acyltransferase [Chitinophaga arvensicola]SEW49673.1 Peptidoglycan/LPS O-acetylase OafA/YrhL, contains acyltransferase and SGNH-hydrolase domains [Chitinophaga arvensicola]